GRDRATGGAIGGPGRAPHHRDGAGRAAAGRAGAGLVDGRRPGRDACRNLGRPLLPAGGRGRVAGGTVVDGPAGGIGGQGRVVTVLAAALLAAAAVGLSPRPRRRVGWVFGGRPSERTAGAARSVGPQPVAARPVAPSPWLGRWFGGRHRHPAKADLPSALALDLVAAVLDAGAPPGAAIGLVAAALAAVGGAQAAELAAAAVPCDGAPGC